MEIKTGAKYVILVNIGQLYTYIATIISQDKNFITITDVKNKTFTFNKNIVVSLTPFINNYKKIEVQQNGDKS